MLFRPSVLSDRWTTIHQLFPRWTSFSNFELDSPILNSLGSISTPSTGYTAQYDSYPASFYLANISSPLTGSTTTSFLEGLVSVLEEINFNLVEEQHSAGLTSSNYEIPSIYLLNTNNPVTSLSIRTDTGWVSLTKTNTFQEAILNPYWQWVQEDETIAIVGLGLIEESPTTGWVHLDTSNWARVGPVWYREPNLEKWLIIPKSNIRADGNIYKYSTQEVKLRYYKSNFQAICPYVEVKCDDVIYKANIAHLWTKTDELTEIVLDDPRKPYESSYDNLTRITNWINYTNISKRGIQAGISAALGLATAGVATGSPTISFTANQLDVIPSLNRFWSDTDILYSYNNVHKTTTVPTLIKAVDVLDPLTISGNNILGQNYATKAYTFGTNYTKTSNSIVVERYFFQNLSYLNVKGVKFVTSTKKPNTKWSRMGQERITPTSSTFI